MSARVGRPEERSGARKERRSGGRPTLIMLVALVACQQNKSAPPAPPPPPPASAVADAAPGSTVAIEIQPGLVQPRPEGSEKDCRISQVIRRRWAGAVVKSCGALTLRDTPEQERADDELARPCITGALAAKQPFVVEREVRGTDSGVARAIVGVMEGAKFQVYALSFDSNPCGGGCPERGHTLVVKCEDFKLVPIGACPFMFECFECTSETPVEDCRFGPLTYGCKSNKADEAACEAKGMEFAYGPHRSKYCEQRPYTGDQRAAEAKILETKPCECLNVAAETHYRDTCSDKP